MTLYGKVLGNILELNEEQISYDQGVDRIILRLTDLYKKDELNEKFEDFGKTCRVRQPETSLQQFNVDFNQKYHKLRQHVTTITEDLFAFKLLKAAILTSHQINLLQSS